MNPDDPAAPREDERAGLAEPGSRASRNVVADRRMLEALVCPGTQGRLDFDRERQELISRAARLAFPIREGIPILLVSEARALEE